MSIESALKDRSGSVCELCGSTEGLTAYAIPDSPSNTVETSILLCSTCSSQVEGSDLDENHWRCLNDSMWSEHPAVQVMAYRMLHKINAPWSLELVEQMYLDDETLKWAKQGVRSSADSVVIKDSNGTQLAEGDTVHLIKDLVVKGANFTAKRGTIVRNIRLTENPEHIEGKINGSMIVIVSAYTKKQ